MTSPRISRRLGLALIFGYPMIVMAAARPEAPNLSGTWSWQWKDGQGVVHRHTLDVEGTGKTLAARERFDDLAPVKVDDLKIEGKKVSFSVTRGDRHAEYAGTMTESDTLNGRVTVVVENQSNEFTWTAKRESGEKK